MGESLRKILAGTIFICLCGLTAILLNNDYICEGITAPLLPVAESKAAETIAFWEGLGCCGLFIILLFLSRLFRNLVAVFFIAIGINKVIEWIFRRD